MLNRRSLLASLGILATLSFTSGAGAAEKVAFSSAAFEAAKSAGRPILIDVSAPWCPVCKAQAPILSELTSQPKFKNLAFFEVDFDSQKDALRALSVQRQSTLIVFKGGKEVGRSVGDTNKASIAALLNKSL